MKRAAGVFLFLVVLKNLAAWKFAAGAFRAGSLTSLAVHGLPPLLGAGAAAAVFWGAGRRMLRLAEGKTAAEGNGVPHAAAFGLGLGAVGTSLFFAGLAGALNAAAAVVVLALAAAIAAPELYRALPYLPRRGRGLGRLPTTSGGGTSSGLPSVVWWRGLLAGVLAYAAWHAVVLALAPPAGWDVTAYHLALPKLYVRDGAVRTIPWLLHSHWPHMMEVLYTLPLLAGFDQAAGLLHAAVCGVFVGAVFQAARRELDVKTAWIGAALLVCQPAFLRVAPMAHSDGAYAMFVFLSSWYVWRWTRERERSRLVVGGVLGGLAAATKLLGIYPVLMLAAWIAVHVRKERRGGRAAAILYLACALAVAAPWYLKTWVGAGNPVWPFFSGLLGGSAGAARIESVYLHSNYWAWPPAPSLLLRYGPQYLLVPAAVLSALAVRRGGALPGFLRFLLVQALLFVPLVLRHNEGWRFFLPFYPALALTAAWAAAWLMRGATAAAAGAALLVLYGLLPLGAVTQNNELFPVLGLRSSLAADRDPRELYLERTLDNYGFYRRMNAALGPRDKVLLFREIRGYYLDVDYMWGDPLNQGTIAYADCADADRLLRRLKELGVTHILVNKGLDIYAPRPGYYDPRTVLMMERLLSRFARRVMVEGRIELHRLD